MTCWYKVLKGHLSVRRVNCCSKDGGSRLGENYGKPFREGTTVSPSREADAEGSMCIEKTKSQGGLETLGLINLVFIKTRKK